VVAQILLENTRLMVRAVKDGVVLELATILEAVRLQLHDHAFGFGIVVAAGGDGDLLAMPQFGPQLLVEQLFVVRDDVVGGLEDSYGRPVILL
jgi:hypothetical protein